MQNVHFKNWSETIECYPELFFAPKTVEEVKDILQLAQETNKIVHVVGSKHSSSDIACTPDVMISMQCLNGILEVNKTNLQVKVQAGMILSELNDILYSHNLALSVLGSTSEITVGGAISVATHGSGINYGTLSSYVTEMDLMVYDGSIISLSPDDKNPEFFLAAVCGLGACGVILNVTLQCEPAYNLQLRQYDLSLKDVIENLDVHLEESEHFKFLWFPHTEGVIVSHCSRTTLNPKEPCIWKWWNWFWAYVIGHLILEFYLYVSTFFPHLVPSINRLFYNFFSGAKTKIDRSYKIFNNDYPIRRNIYEWATPIKNTGLVLWRLKEWIESTPDIYVHFPVEVRFSRAEQIFLSPSYGRSSCYISINIYRPYGKDVSDWQGYTDFLTAFEKIMTEAEGRPHWAKAHSVTAAQFNLMYPHFRSWCAIRHELDPINMFLNPYMLRILN